MRRKRQALKEFSFFGAVLAAVLLHAVVGIFLKYNPLLVAAPVAPVPASRPPLSLRFVEAPEGAPNLPAPPQGTKYASDANRKAGPLVPTPEQKKPQVRQYASSGSRVRAAQPMPSPSPMQPEPREQIPGRSEEVSETPAAPLSEQGELPPGARESLAKSLHNLDQFIRGGEDGTSSGGTGPAQPGGVPTGDPGSGVFFDTQGYDLGPWGNRVVGIVRRNWIVPTAAELGLKGVVGISFQVDKNGRILEPKVISTSGVPSFDQAALAALYSSNPLPPLPADFPRPALPAVFRFYYNTPVPD